MLHEWEGHIRILRPPHFVAAGLTLENPPLFAEELRHVPVLLRPRHNYSLAPPSLTSQARDGLISDWYTFGIFLAASWRGAETCVKCCQRMNITMKEQIIATALGAALVLVLGFAAPAAAATAVSGAQRAVDTSRSADDAARARLAALSAIQTPAQVDAIVHSGQRVVALYDVTTNRDIAAYVETS